MSVKFKLFTFIIFPILLTTCGRAESTPLSTIGASEPDVVNSAAGQNGERFRTILTYEDLINGFDSTSPLDEAALTIPKDAARTAHKMESEHLVSLDEKEQAQVDNTYYGVGLFTN